MTLETWWDSGALGRSLVERRRLAPALRKGVVFLGQSNMAMQGWGDTSTHAAPGITEPQRGGVGGAFAPVSSRVKASWSSPVGDPISWTIDSTAPLGGVTSTVNNPTVHTTNLIGPQQSCMRHLDYYLPNVWDCSTVAITATSLAVHWLPTGTYPTAGSNLLTQAMDVTDAHFASTGAAPAAVVWGQGESDGGSTPQAAAYNANLTAEFAAFRARWPGIPIVCIKLSIKNTVVVTEMATIRAAQVAVCAATSNCVLVDTDDATMQPDGAHFTSDYCTGLGDKIANAIVGLLGLSVPSPVAWTIDPTMLVACPASTAEWQALFAAANSLYGVGITSTGPTSIYGCQVAASPLTDVNGVHPMASSGTGTITFQATNGNWARGEFVIPAGGTIHFETTDASLPDPAAASWAHYGYHYLTSGAASINIISYGTAGFSTVQRSPAAPTFNSLGLFEGGVLTSGTVQVTPGSRPLVHCRNKTTSLADVMTDAEHIQANTGVVTGRRETIGVAGAGLGVNMQLGTFYVARFEGAQSELTPVQWKAVLRTANWGNVNLGMPAITWT